MVCVKIFAALVRPFIHKSGRISLQAKAKSRPLLAVSVFLTLWHFCLLPLAYAGASALSTDQRPIRIAAASDLRFALEDLKKEFIRTHSSTTNEIPPIELIFGSTGNLVQQILKDAPFDLFLAADLKSVLSVVQGNKAASKDLFRYGKGRLVLWLGKKHATTESGELTKASLQASQLQFLADPKIEHIAIANPEHAPYGRAALAALQASGLYDLVKPKLVYGETLAQAAQFVQSGAADAGFIALGYAKALEKQEGGSFLSISSSLYEELDQTGLVLKSGQCRSEVLLFKNFLLGPEAQGIWKAYGYSD